MATWESFHPRIMVHVPGATIPLVEQELRIAAAEFFDMTRAWVEWITPITTLANQSSYAMAPPTGSRIVRLERARIDGIDLTVLPFRLVEPGMAGADSRDLASLRFNTLPAAGSLVEIEASLAPNDAATGLPDHLFARYADALANGAVSRIKAIKGYEFSDSAGASDHDGKFQAAINKHMTRAWKSNTRNTPRQRPNWC